MSANMSEADVKENLFVDLSNAIVFKGSLLSTGPSEAHIKIINTLLSTSKTFRKGLEFLDHFLNFCTVEIISDNTINWIYHCLKRSENQYIGNKLSIIGKLIEISSSRLVSDYLLKIVDLCLNSNNDLLASLDVLTIALTTYSSWFTNHKLRIEIFLIGFLEHSTESVVEKAAIAFMNLQLVGNAGIDGINHRKNFQESFRKLCTTFHDLLDQFFENWIDIDDFNKPYHEGFKFPEQCVNSQQMIPITARRLKNVLTFIYSMLKESFPIRKEIFPMDIINLVNRGTTVHHCLTEITRSFQDDYNFSFNLNKIQVQLIQLLRIFIVWLDNNALPFSNIISKILIDCMKKTQNCKCFDQDVSYKESVCQTLNCWISTAATGLNPFFQDQLVTSILKDITPKRNLITLKIQTDANKGKGKKKKISNNLITQKNLPSNDFNNVCSRNSRKKDEYYCQLALNTLKTFFDSAYIRLEERVIQNIYTLVISILNDINSCRIPHPYSNEKCQSNLSELLVAFYKQDTMSNYPIISHSINILNDSCSSKNNDVANASKQGLNNLEVLCQPITRPFNTFSFPLKIISPRQNENGIESDEFSSENNLVIKTHYSKSEILILENKVILPGNTDKQKQISDKAKKTALNRVSGESQTGDDSGSFDMLIIDTSPEEPSDTVSKSTNKNNHVVNTEQRNINDLSSCERLVKRLAIDTEVIDSSPEKFPDTSKNGTKESSRVVAMENANSSSNEPSLKRLKFGANDGTNVPVDSLEMAFVDEVQDF